MVGTSVRGIRHTVSSVVSSRNGNGAKCATTNAPIAAKSAHMNAPAPSVEPVALLAHHVRAIALVVQAVIVEQLGIEHE